MSEANSPPATVLPVALVNKKALLIGAGSAARLKAQKLKESRLPFAVVAKEIKDPYFNSIPVLLAPFDFEHLEGADMVINASGDRALSERLWMERKRYGYLLNCVDTPNFCDFFFQAEARDNALVVSVSSSGFSPSYAADVRDILSAVIPRKSANFYAELKKRRRVPSEKNKVYLIGVGAGGIDNLTVKALKTLKFLDVALTDAHIGEDIKALLRKDVVIINAAKHKGHPFPQEEINRLILEYVGQGLTVGRLKGGDPLIFGRSFEEAGFLLGHGVEVEVVGGITSGLACALRAGVMPTARGVSAGVILASAHLAGARYNDNWLDYLKNDPPYTIIVYMALSLAAKIEESARAKGVGLDTPALFVTFTNDGRERIAEGTLGELGKISERCDPPAVLILGGAVSGRLKFL